MIKGVLTHHPIPPVALDVQQKMTYLRKFFHFSTLMGINPVTGYNGYIRAKSRS